MTNKDLNKLKKAIDVFTEDIISSPNKASDYLSRPELSNISRKKSKEHAQAVINNLSTEQKTPNYDDNSPYVIGYHAGSRERIKDKLHKHDFWPSVGLYEWLGIGLYFWENNYNRSVEWAKEGPGNRSKNEKVKKQEIIGAVISLKNCLDLTRGWASETLKYAHASLCKIYATNNKTPPSNNSRGSRYLDRNVINHLYNCLENGTESAPFDSVRGAFTEGDPIFPNSSFHQQDHIQLCVRHPRCILGYFRPQASFRKELSEVKKLFEGSDWWADSKTRYYLSAFLDDLKTGRIYSQHYINSRCSETKSEDEKIDIRSLERLFRCYRTGIEGQINEDFSPILKFIWENWFVVNWDDISKKEETFDP